MKNSADLGGCYPPRPSASMDNTLLDLQNSSYPTQPHSISNGNRTEWSPIRSVIIRVTTKSDDREAGVRFVHHEYDYRPNIGRHEVLLPINHKNYNFREKNSQIMKEGENLH